MHRVISTAAGPTGHRLASWLLVKNSPNFALEQARSYTVPASAEPFLSGSSGQYVEDMYNAWLADPSSVHTSWDSFFRNSAQGGPGYQPPPSLAPLGRNEVSANSLLPMVGSMTSGVGQISEKAIDDHLAVQAIIRSYQTRCWVIFRSVATALPCWILWESTVRT
ncbi:unnamed protein product [Phaedon cochleariae]|uniref:2-oxoglutarate dehydrogenase, mitochondrial n=1 Tax=Phaedon cochleariae TaxID=80249 RepID=A0A9N9SJC1_PHACE|nr:unnamed protein product [Phaedon cochleariae]